MKRYTSTTSSHGKKFKPSEDDHDDDNHHVPNRRSLQTPAERHGTGVNMVAAATAMSPAPVNTVVAATFPAPVNTVVAATFPAPANASDFRYNVGVCVESNGPSGRTNVPAAEHNDLWIPD